MRTDSDPPNPYASPAVADAVDRQPISRQEALRRLRLPAYGLIVFSIVNIAWQILFLIPWSLALTSGEVWLMTLNEFLDWMILSTLVALVTVLQPIILVGLVRLLRGKTGRLTWAAAVGGLVPCASPCACGSFLFALWLLILLGRNEIRAAIAAAEGPTD